MKKIDLSTHNFVTSSTLDIEEVSSELQYTGRFLLTHPDEKVSSSKLASMIEEKLGIKSLHSKEVHENDFFEENYFDYDSFIIDRMGVALIGPEDPDMIQALSNQRFGDLIIEPELLVTVPKFISTGNSSSVTYGLHQTNVVNSQYTGRGVKIAVLDTGMDLNHPDFAQRNITSQSFVPNEAVNDENGHGTHCIGTACGNADNNGNRYGVAKDAEIYVAKVLSNQGSGAQSWIIKAMDWAVRNGCNIISMSLGSRVYPGMNYNNAYEKAAKNAMKNGTLVVAASGNESHRQRRNYNPIGSPANCPSIMAIAALDSNQAIANFSNRSINPDGQMDLSAPGVNVYSSWPSPSRYKTISGTSMATPHVAGIAALYKEANPSASSGELWNLVTRDAKRLLAPTVDVGIGLVQAP